jgi:polyhydroxyalkanoate synthesis regulator phasin
MKNVKNLVASATNAIGAVHELMSSQVASLLSEMEVLVQEKAALSQQVQRLEKELMEMKANGTK